MSTALLKIRRKRLTNRAPTGYNMPEVNSEQRGEDVFRFPFRDAAVGVSREEAGGRPLPPSVDGASLALRREERRRIPALAGQSGKAWCFANWVVPRPVRPMWEGQVYLFCKAQADADGLLPWGAARQNMKDERI